MKAVFGGAIALALVLVQPIGAEDPKADKTDGDKKRILDGANQDPWQEIAAGELKTCKSLLTMSKKACERAAKLQQLAAERLHLVVKDYPDTPEGMEAARLLALDNSAPRPCGMASAAANIHRVNTPAPASGGMSRPGSARMLEVVTRVEGLSGLVMDLVDLDDPVEIGADTAYLIRVTNTGSQTKTNLQLVCVSHDKMEFRGANWNCHLQGKEVVFEPLPKLAPRADMLFRVNARGIARGDVRFRARITADGLTEPVQKEESTRVYGD